VDFTIYPSGSLSLSADFYATRIYTQSQIVNMLSRFQLGITASSDFVLTNNFTTGASTLALSPAFLTAFNNKQSALSFSQDFQNINSTISLSSSSPTVTSAISTALMSYTPTAQLVTPWITGRLASNGAATIGSGQVGFTVTKPYGAGYFEISFASAYANGTNYNVLITAQANAATSACIATWGNFYGGGAFTSTKFGVRMVSLAGALADCAFSIVVY
jgi:hypothetical protein